ncbi:hypothetical protein ACWE42_17575 [Sutcliffiella cohnii]|uniref:Uncharacterized protein n=1 Tax=Sutcliffiella cohnii TaxID=33932 RepID=A0A223KUI4_9BACI|nr:MULTISPECIES: hypothetical protein [Sutcliffiella]AST92983.1 hypothetical protein BC6307_17805 [Sutcliffiella cohnii]MED4018459.1 hypothetical protein [Sutcliffiella cohnii]WBL14249.1 hypothetical protein O1A01_20555 [Sutcliffiella sp. NC1]
MKLKAFLFLTVLCLLVACGNDEEKKKKEKEEATPKTEETQRQTGNYTTLEELENMDISSENFNWDDIYISRETFNEILKGLTEPDAEEEVLIDRAEYIEPNTIEIVINNKEGESLENTFQAVFLDTFIRQFYKHSELYKEEEPRIRIVDLDEVVVAENTEPINFDEEENANTEEGN